jgi:hypothetical protein
MGGWGGGGKIIVGEEKMVGEFRVFLGKLGGGGGGGG